MVGKDFMGQKDSLKMFHRKGNNGGEYLLRIQVTTTHRFLSWYDKFYRYDKFYSFSYGNGLSYTGSLLIICSEC